MSEVKANRVASFEEMKSAGDFILEVLHPPNNLRDLTDEEHERYDKFGYLKYESYPDDDGIVGKYWTKDTLDAVANGSVVTGITFRCPCGCGEIGGIHFAVYQPQWTWNGSKDKPTCTPSIRRLDGCRWHGYLTDGVFRSC